MHVASLSTEDDFAGWRDAARVLASAGVSPADIVWRVGDEPGDLLGTEPTPLPNGSTPFAVPRPFIALAETAILHADRARFALLYALLVRLRDQPGLIQDQADPLLRRIDGLAKEVQRDIHKMRAF